MNFRKVSDQSIQSIYGNNYDQPTVNLTMTFLKPAGEANLYVQFGYALQTICYQIQGHVSGSMNSDMINENKQVNNQQLLDQNYNQKKFLQSKQNNVN